MRKLKNEAIAVHSGYETQVISRASTFGQKDTFPNPRITHEHSLPPTYDEVVFFDRELTHGELQVDKHISTLAIQGLRGIAALHRTHRNVEPHVAEAFLAVLDQPQPEEAIPAKPAGMQPPAFENNAAEIIVYQRVPQPA